MDDLSTTETEPSVRPQVTVTALDDLQKMKRQSDNPPGNIGFGDRLSGAFPLATLRRRVRLNTGQ